ncbi:hypothetical protein B0H14DRAFT_3712722 [Mycena olivaceomarginata]|nr:hypothetical protein B0H14DRAFT_3712722 [Mycena olivaceomarginata]
MTDGDYDELSSGSDGVADDDVDGMIQSLANKNPAVTKWMVTSPQLMKQQEKLCQARQKRKEKKDKKKENKRRRDEDDDDDDGAPKPKKKAKQDEDPLDYPIVPLTGYIHVMKPTTTLPKSRGTKVRPEDSYIQRGPFQFISDCSFDEFITLMSTVLPCDPSYIVLEKVAWKPQTPANRAPLPLGGDIGFRVLQRQISLSKDHIVIISMPDPRKPVEDTPDTGAGGNNLLGAGAEAGPSSAVKPKAEFDYAQLEASSTEEAVAEQKMSFDKAVAPHVEELKEHWPENDAGKWIYTDVPVGAHSDPPQCTIPASSA